MMDASFSENEAYSAADEEIDILKNRLGDDFVLKDTLVFDSGGLVCVTDATYIRRYEASLETPYPIGEPFP